MESPLRSGSTPEPVIVRQRKVSPGEWSRLLRERNFLVYVLGNAISWLGTWAQRIGIGWLSWDLTHQTFWVGAISLALVLPLVFFGPLFGTLLDRHDHRRYSMGVNVCLALLALSLYLLTSLHVMRIELLCVMAVLVGVANSAYQAVRLVMISDLVAPHQLSAAIAINSLLYHVARAVGPAIAGVIIAHSGIASAFAVNSVSFIGILVALRVVKLRPRELHSSPHGLLAQSLEGLRYLLHHAELRQLLLLSGITSILAMGVIELLPVFADGIFHRGSAGLAALTTAAGTGAIVGASVLSLRVRLPLIVHLATFSVGGVVCLFGLCTTFEMALLVAALLGFNIVLCSVGLQVLLQVAVGTKFRGRVLGLWTAVSVAGPDLGGALIGYVAQLRGLKLVTISSGLACVVLVSLIRLSLHTLPPQGGIGLP